MKTLLTIFMICFPVFGIGQYTQQKCGTWVEDSLTISDWNTIDTLRQVNSSERSWIYDEWVLQMSYTMDAVYRPCGSAGPIIWKRRRICTLTGIIQEQTKTQNYRYIPPVKSRFEKVKDSMEIIKAKSIVDYFEIRPSADVTAWNIYDGAIITDTISYIPINKFYDTIKIINTKDLLDYEKECYNDSTEVVWFFIPLIGKTDIDRNGFDSLKIEFPDEVHYLFSTYNHKPITFEGFIKYMKTK